MTEEQYENVMRELDKVKERLWTKENMDLFTIAITEIGNVMREQTKVIEKQTKLLLRVEKTLEEDDYEPEPKILVS